MKKILLSLGAAVLLAGTASAQISYGVKVGVNFAEITNLGPGILNGDVARDFETLRAEPGTGVGGVIVEDYEAIRTSVFLTGYADIPVFSNFSVQPGISLQAKGGKIAGVSGNLDGSLIRELLFIEVPVNVVYSIPTGSVGSVLVGAGPYVGYAVMGTDRVSKTYVRFLDNQVTAKVRFSGEPKDLLPSTDDNPNIDKKDINNLDAGVNFLLGFKTAGGFLVNANYGLGLMNLNPYTEPVRGGETWNSRVLSFGVGLQF